MRSASSESESSVRRGSAAVQSSSAASSVGATAAASAQRDRSRDTTTRRPSRPCLREASFILSPSSCPDLFSHSSCPDLFRASTSYFLATSKQGRRGWQGIRAFTPVFDGLCPAMTIFHDGFLGLALVRIEILAQAGPAVGVIVLPGVELGGIFGHALAKAGLEHEGERVGELHGLELGV